MGPLFNAISKFLWGGFHAFSPAPEPDDDFSEPTEEEAEDILKEFGNFMQALGEEAEKAQGPRSLVTPFEVLMSKYASPEAAESNSAFIECMLSALTDMADEIKMIVPESQITTSVDRADSKKHDVFKGYLKWKLDNVDPMVYPISVGLLRDGFIFVKEENSYVITVKVEK